MRITEDYSYLSNTDNEAIKKGIATRTVYSIRIDRFFTEEEKEENRKRAETVTPAEWSKFCDAFREQLAEQNVKAMEELAKVFKIGQYNYNRKYETGDFWFWCNFGDMSYLTLSTDNEKTPAERNETSQRATDILKDVPTVNNQAIIQYTAVYDETKLKQVADDYIKRTGDNFVRYGVFGEGKLYKQGNDYFFKKKHSKKWAYEIPASAVFDIMVNNNNI